MAMRTSLCVLSLLALMHSAGADESARSVFEQRIMPIFRSEKPSSCVQCHLASVDLKDYIRPSHEETFLALRDQGLIELDNPIESKILRLIRMGDADQDPMARRIHEKMRNAELEAFTSWILRCCEDKQLVARPSLDDASLAMPSMPNEVIRYARKDRVLDSFVRHIWSQRMRCFPCHTPGEIDRGDAKSAKPLERYTDFKKKYGAKMDIFKSTPKETMRAWIAASGGSHAPDRFPLINLEVPADSLLVLKPTSKVPGKMDDGSRAKPSSVIPVSHVGGLKMHKDDVSYKAFVTWIEDVGKLKRDAFEKADDLPTRSLYPTKHILRLKDLPSSWKNFAAVQVQVFSRDRDAKQESPSRLLAITQSLVTPRRFVNGALFAVRSTEESDGANDPVLDWNSDGVALPDGDYQIKVYLDRTGRVQSDATVWLGEGDLVAELDISAAWGDGFKNAQVVSLQESVE